MSPRIFRTPIMCIAAGLQFLQTNSDFGPHLVAANDGYLARSVAMTAAAE
jgi:hypothetical protein